MVFGLFWHVVVFGHRLWCLVNHMLWCLGIVGYTACLDHLTLSGMDTHPIYISNMDTHLCPEVSKICSFSSGTSGLGSGLWLGLGADSRTAAAVGVKDTAKPPSLQHA